MLTLLEPIKMNTLLDRPDLGCAMLIASCQKNDIKTTLIKGQTRYLKDMFINDSEELWYLIKDLKKDKLGDIKISEYKKYIREKGLGAFRGELRNLYQYVIADKSPKHYFNGLTIEKFDTLNNIFGAVYFHFLTELKYCKLKIIDHYISEIIKSDPRYIGFSLHGNFDPISRIIRKRIKESTGIPIIIGGSLTPFIDRAKDLDKIFDKEYFDYLVIGAGERALPSLINALNNKKRPKGIANVFYRSNRRIQGNELEAIDDLGSLPYPDYSQFDLDLYMTPKRILPLQTARGCAWRKCAFCSHYRIYLNKYRTFTINYLIEMIKYLKKAYSCSHFALHDDDLPPGRAKIIGKAILNNNVKDISLYSYARLTNGYDNNELLGCLRKAGFSTFAWGLESGSQRVLDSMNKGTKLTTMSRVLKKSNANGITNICFVFFGFPGETEEEAQETVEFLKKHADYIDEVMDGSFGLAPYSPVWKCPEKWGVVIKKDGSFSTKSGMSPKKVNAFFLRFREERKLNSIKISSAKLICVMPGFNRRMLRFLASSYGLLPNKLVLERLDKKNLSCIFPIILGEIRAKDNKRIFRPINVSETCFINRTCPQKEISLDDITNRIFILSNGKLSIKDIFLAVHEDFRGKYNKRYVCKKNMDFFRKIFSKKQGLGFAQSWR